MPRGPRRRPHLATADRGAGAAAAALLPLLAWGLAAAAPEEDFPATLASAASADTAATRCNQLLHASDDSTGYGTGFALRLIDEGAGLDCVSIWKYIISNQYTRPHGYLERLYMDS